MKADLLHRLYLRAIHTGRGYQRLTHRFVRGIRRITKGLDILSVVASVILLAALVLYLGFNHSAEDIEILRRMIRGAQIVFIADILIGLTLDARTAIARRGVLKIIVDSLVLLTLLPLIYPRPEHPWIAWLDALLYSRRFLYPVLAAYALLDVSGTIMRLIGRRTNPSLLLSGSFIVFIFIGSLLLMLPRSTYAGISFVDALFMSTSAVCINGLASVDVFTTFTPLGVTILAVLMQIGALGVMTFTSFFALFFSGRASIYSQLMLKDMIYSKSMSSLVPTLLYILGFTVVLELAGAVAVFFSINSTLGLPLGQTIAISLFHSLSSFCNAGLSIIPGGMSNNLLLYGNISIYWVTSLIVVLGAIGFPILVNFKDAIALRLRCLWAIITHRKITEPRSVHPFNMNTKIVLLTFSILFLVGFIAILVLEWNNTLAGMTIEEKITQAVFNSVTPRSAGFSSVNPGGFLNSTLIIVMFLMWVGGGSQSTAGGVKVNTLAAIWLNLRAIISGRDRVTAFRRTIAVWSIRRANATVAMSIISYLIFALTILILEPALPARDLLFETLSALFSVGSSLGVTSSLGPAALMVISVAMFLGRVGIISIIAGFATRRHDSPAAYPTDNLIIN